MTLIRNTDSRKNERRIGALRRLERQLASDLRRNSGFEYPLTSGDRDRITREVAVVGLRLRPAEQLRAIRTKKDRSGTGRLSR